MSNPLVAPVKDSTTAVSGVPLLEGALDLKSAIESGDWASVAMGAVGTALDALTAVMDPFGAVFAAGVGWLIEHVGPLKEALNALTGNADEIAAQAETWTNIAKELGEVSVELVDLVEKDLGSWSGEAADAYRKQAKNTATLIESAQKGSEGAGSGVKTAGEVVAAVRTLVRDIIAELIGHLISWALQVVFTLGIGLAWVVPQVVAAVAKTASKITGLTTKLVKALKALTPLLKKVDDLFGDAAKALKNLKGGTVKPSGKPKDIKTKSPDSKPKPNPKDENTSPSGDHTNPSGDHGPSGDKGNTGGDKGGSGGGDKNGNTNPTGDHVTPSGSGGGSGGGTKSPPPGRGENPPNKPAAPDELNLCGDPIDIATGEVVMVQDDLSLAGPLPIRIRRTHMSSYREGTGFGPSWASTADLRLEFTADHAHFFSDDGTVMMFPRPLPGLPMESLAGPSRVLMVDEAGLYRLVTWDSGITLCFAPVSGAPAGVLPLTAFELGEDGPRIEVDHDADGAGVRWRHSDGRVLEIDRARGRIHAVRMTDPGQGQNVVVMRYGYDDAGNLTEVTNSSGRALRFDYDPQGRLAEWQDRNGIWYRYIYDAAGRCVRTVGDRGFLDCAFEYEPRRTRYTNSLGHVTVFELDGAHHVVRETDPLGASTVFTWDDRGRMLSKTDPLGRTTRFTYNADGEISKVTRPDDTVVLVNRSEDGAVDGLVADEGDHTRYRAYPDGLGPDPRQDPVGVSGGITIDTGPESDDPGTEDHDLFGRPRSVPHGRGRARIGWTVEGLRAWRVGSLSERQSWRYDSEGNEIEHVDPSGRATRREYGPFDMLTAEIDPAGGRTQYAYDTELRPATVTNPAGLTWTYEYDPAGRLVRQTDFDGRPTTYAYDAAGQLVRSVDPAGRATEYGYDLIGNLVRIRTDDAETTYAYDVVGELVRADDGESVVEFERDENGRTVRTVTDGLEVIFEYDSAQGAISRRTPSGATSVWSFDKEERPSALSTADHLVEYAYDTEGRPIDRRVDGGARLRQQFDADDRIVGQTLTDATGTVLRHREFARSADGDLTAIRDAAGGESFGRDAAGRITTHLVDGVREDVAYDRAGKVVQWATTNVAYPEAGQRTYERNTVTSAGVVRYEHDVSGRRTARHEGDRIWRYEWDARNRLTGLTTPDGRRWRYRYDPLGRRTAKELLGPDGQVVEEVRFVWDGNALIEQAHTGPSGVTVTTWERRPDTEEPVTQTDQAAGSVRFQAFVNDSIGTPTDLLDPVGIPNWSGRWTLWGLPLPGTPFPGTPLRFPGQYLDAESGLHYNLHRYFDPATARYLSQDPLGLPAGPDPAGYPHDPTSGSDPLGLVWCPKKRKFVDGPGTSGTGHNAGNTGGSAKRPRTENDNANRGGRTKNQAGTTEEVTATYDKNSTRGKDFVNQPDKNQVTDVDKLNENSVIHNKVDTDGSVYGENKLSDELVETLENTRRNKPDADGNQFLRADEKWIRGHLENGDMGGPGTADNMIPLTHTANMNYKKLESSLHTFVDINPALARRDASDIAIDFKVKPSDEVKFPKSDNDFERGIRDHVEINTQYTGITPDIAKRLMNSKMDVPLPDLPPLGTKFDTISGKFTKPDGTEWIKNPKGHDLSQYL
ncbi:rhs protein [Amycolatopsis thailandensis]|uniref:Rhs protein n=1 Tax=Amycolatopsis thailandensis TaxID=589330 RepID=A0A229RSM1_9PSEU|nr:DUF6531 domain-containing protein [Amycolatopsis thailandensis]OXM49394.1 rhs protein [Amycolatopsis thailandensis]